MSNPPIPTVPLSDSEKLLRTKFYESIAAQSELMDKLGERLLTLELASETATLDNLSNGRVILAVGLGALDSGFQTFGEVTDRKRRAELLDEGLDILTGLWRGQPFSYQGKHYTVQETDFYPPAPPVQKPRIPIWVVGAWPSEKSMRRAMRYDGLLPNVLGEDGRVRMGSATPDEIRAMKNYIQDNRDPGTPIDIVVEGETPGDDPVQATAVVRPFAEAGATWWIEALWTASDLDLVLRRIQQGPPGHGERPRKPART